MVTVKNDKDIVRNVSDGVWCYRHQLEEALENGKVLSVLPSLDSTEIIPYNTEAWKALFCSTGEVKQEG